MNRIVLFLAMTAAPGLTFAANTNVITFNGQVASQTCTVSVNGSAANPVILMPTVSAAALTAVGSTAGETPFTISVSGCTAPTSNLAIKTAFLGNNVTSAGNLANAGTASNVQVQLLNAAGGSAVVLNGITSVSGLTLNSGATSASHDFAVRYISEAGAATAGTVSATAQYALDYL